MKRLEISRLMDEYTDTEFFPEGGSAANPQAVRGWVLANAKAPAAKKRAPGRKKLLLAAALAAVMVALAGAGLPSVIYRLAAGGTLEFMEDAESRTVTYRQGNPPIALEDGRLYFVLDGQHTDLTGQISEDTPYLYDAGDPEQDLVCYLILGGTPDNYGWMEWTSVPDPFTPSESIRLSDGSGRLCSYDYTYTIHGGSENQESYTSGGTGVGTVAWEAGRFRPWLLAGLEELGIPYEIVPPEKITTFSSP